MLIAIDPVGANLKSIGLSRLLDLSSSSRNLQPIFLLDLPIHRIAYGLVAVDCLIENARSICPIFLIDRTVTINSSD
jgi:hypothetical protein